MMKKVILFDSQSVDGEDLQYAWEDFLLSISKDTLQVVVTGYFMSWMGPQSGGKVYSNLRSAIENIIMDDSHFVFMLDEQGNLLLNETHHDAPINGNLYVFKVLTPAGSNWYEKYTNEKDRRTICETLFNNRRYSRKPLKKELGL